MPRILLIVFILMMALTLLVPLGEVVRMSFLDELGAPTLANYKDMLGAGYFRNALLQTLAFCLFTSVGAALLGLPAAWRIGRSGPGAVLLRGFCQANYAFGGVVYGMLAVALIGNVGLVPIAEYQFLGTEMTRGFVYTTAGLVVAYAGFQIPRCALLLAQAVEKLDPDLLSASRTLGARPAQTAMFVTVPLLGGAIVNATVSTFLISIASFGVALLVTRSFPIFGMLVFKEFVGFANFGTACAMAVSLAVAAFATAGAMRRLASGSIY
jgi:ABC-type Fe3+ transport system permease subunit